MSQKRVYHTTVKWTGNQGDGTLSYNSYSRDHLVSSEGKPDIPGSSDPSFRGDRTRYNPEELLVASLSACHMLWYLHLCAVSGVVVTDYHDQASGVIEETENQASFSEVTLYPTVTVSEGSMVEKAEELHREANRKCFIANSMKFPVYHQPVINVQNEAIDEK